MTEGCRNLFFDKNVFLGDGLVNTKKQPPVSKTPLILKVTGLPPRCLWSATHSKKVKRRILQEMRAI